MNKKYIIILMILTLSGYLINQKLFVKDLEKDLETNSLVKNLKVKASKKIKAVRSNKTLLHIAQLISPPSDIELKDSWEDEYTCYNDESCNEFIFNARSYEDALWLKRKGYPTKSIVAMLNDISKNDLWELGENGNINAKNLLALNALNHKDIKNARNQAMSSIAYSQDRETFAYRLLAESLLMEQDPMNATYYLRVASLLGDTNATARYEQITARSSSALIDNTNQMAYNYLLKKLNTDISNLNNDPRPIGGG